MKAFKMEFSRNMANELSTAIRLYTVLCAETKQFSKEELFRLYTVRHIYHELESKLMKMIIDDKPRTKMKFDTVRAHAICDVIDTVQATTMDLKNIRLELGKHTIKSLSL